MHWILLGLIVMNGYVYKFNRIASIPVGGNPYNVSIMDTDHNGWGELFLTEGSWGVSVWEYTPKNGFREVYRYRTSRDSAITGIGVWDIGDGDKDGLSEILCDIYFHADSAKDGIPMWGMGIIESRILHSFPDTVVWFDPIGPSGVFTDLDSDEKMEIFGAHYEWVNFQWQFKGGVILENQGDNEFTPVVFFPFDTYGHPMPSPLSGDFDGDGKKEFFGAIGSYWATNNVRVWECVGDNDYRLIWEEPRRFTNLHDRWLGNDTDRDSKPEIFLKSYYFGPSPTATLSMYEATGDNTYKWTLIDSISGGGLMSGSSTCGDVDGDGIEEVIVSLSYKVIIYKAVGDDRYERVGIWMNDMADNLDAGAFCYDFNKNGYDEIVVAGLDEVVLLEIDTTCLGITSKPSNFRSCNLSISPNPFKAVTSVKWQVPDERPISLEVYDVTGKLVRILTKIQNPESKTYTAVWDGKDDKGKLLPSGIYFCKLKAGNQAVIKKIILAR